MRNLRKAIHNLTKNLTEQDRRPSISFEEFGKMLAAEPELVIRNVFQVFHDMVKTYVGEGFDEYPDDPESINYVSYDCSKLFVEGADHPFFADRLFANRLVNLVEALKLGAQQNKIYIFEGPHGSGKSTFLNNLLTKFEMYANTKEGTMYETVWRFKRRNLGDLTPAGKSKLSALLESIGADQDDSIIEYEVAAADDEYIEVPCPSHDNPLLMIPKQYRRSFFDDLFANDEFKWRLFTDKEYEWVFHSTACTICSSLFEALSAKIKNPLRVFRHIYARPYHFNRRMGEGVSVFNPGDEPLRQTVLSNPMLQRGINNMLHDSNQVKYIFSRYAKTNNGIYALMDVKSHNKDRLLELHNIISEGVHKIEDVEENVNSLLFALMNPEDKKNIDQYQSLLDRIEYVNIPYVLDLKTEVEIYRNIFGRHINESFLPMVLHNFARVIISSRMNNTSAAMSEWIIDPSKYNLYCDKNLLLLKMEIYIGHIPPWLSEEDRKRLTAKRRRRIIAESEEEGRQGFSGRDAIKIFNEFYSTFAKADKLIDMGMLCGFFRKTVRDERRMIPTGFLDALLNMYDYKTLHELKESLFYYNEARIAADIQNYIYAVNFELGAVELCHYTGDRLEINEEFFRGIELHLLPPRTPAKRFRAEVQKEYTTLTLTQEIMVEGLALTQTNLYRTLYERYVYNLKDKVLEPFVGNENFRRAIKDFQTESFKTYDKKIRDDVSFLITNLCRKYGYTPQSAKEISVYVIDNDLSRRFAKG